MTAVAEERVDANESLLKEDCAFCAKLSTDVAVVDASDTDICKETPQVMPRRERLKDSLTEISKFRRALNATPTVSAIVSLMMYATSSLTYKDEACKER